MSTQAQTALMAPGTDLTALRGVFAELLETQEGLRKVAHLMAGADAFYGIGPAAQAGTHPLAGRWAPDVELITPDGPARLTEVLRNARPLLLDLTGADPSPLAQQAAGWKDRVDVLAASAETPAAARALLIRPDGYVAWAADAPQPDADDCAGLRTELEFWFGAEA
jgi:hypothetical protein